MVTNFNQHMRKKLLLVRTKENNFVHKAGKRRYVLTRKARRECGIRFCWGRRVIFVLKQNHKGRQGSPGGSRVENLPVSTEGTGMTPDPGRPHVSRSNQALAPLSPRSATRGPCTRPKSSPRSLQPAKAHAAMKTHKKFKKKRGRQTLVNYKLTVCLHKD